MAGFSSLPAGELTQLPWISGERAEVSCHPTWFWFPLVQPLRATLPKRAEAEALLLLKNSFEKKEDLGNFILQNI
jgi:hypothetical protein